MNELIKNLIVLQTKFKVRENKRRYALMKIRNGWKNKKGHLYHWVNNDGTMTLDQLMASPLDGVPQFDWANFVQYRRSAAGQVHFYLIL